MDRITKSYLDAFAAEQALDPSVEESTAFELFGVYCVVADLYDDEFDVDEVHVGGGGDLGLDGVAILVNGALVASVEEVEDLLTLSGSIDVQFAFVQTKTGGGFDGGEITTFLDGVLEFFSETPVLPRNEAIKNAAVVSTIIFDNSLKFHKNKPALHLHYMTTGTWTDDVYLSAKIDKGVKALRDIGLFSDIDFHPMGANEVHASYQRTKNKVTAEFIFASKALLPEIPGVSEAYVGVIPAKDFLPLIVDPAGNMRKALFNDNVRDFQDYNPVNIEIRSTLQNVEDHSRFSVLNNGITVVTRGLQITGNKFAMTDYQIVNGCQTSHVLYDERDTLSDGVFVPLKVIATEDEDIINAVITATNRQTQVTTEDLYALSIFQKKLEAFLQAYPDKKQLFYERRSKQYSSINGIEKVRIITKAVQIRAFAAMFLDEPHRASRYYAELRSQVGDRIFNESHKLEPYYAAAYGYYKLEWLFRNGQLPVLYKPARYHMLMAARYLVAGADMPAFTANKVQPYSQKICAALWDDDLATKLFSGAINAVDAATGGAELTRDLVKTQAFTDGVKLQVAPPAT